MEKTDLNRTGVIQKTSILDGAKGRILKETTNGSFLVEMLEKKKPYEVGDKILLAKFQFLIDS